MHNYTRDDIFHIVEEEDVAFIRLQFTDIFGTMKNMAVTVGQLEKALDNRCMFDVSSLEGVTVVGLPSSSVWKRKNSHSGPTFIVYPISFASATAFLST